MKKLIIISSIILTSNLLSGQIINIPADYPTIQQGINAASNNDTVLVDIGTYVENINYSGKNITVASQYLITLDPIYISQTIINGGQNGSVVIFENEESNNAVFKGFTITNGYTNSNGGGIMIDSASPTLEYLDVNYNESVQAKIPRILVISDGNLKNLNISHNESTGYTYGGGGIFFSSSNVIMDSLDIFSNFSTEGGGISVHDNSNLIVTNSLISDNVASSSYSSRGGGINITNSTTTLQNVMISNNLAMSFCGLDGYGGGIYCLGSTLTLSKVSVINNESDFYAGGLCISSGNVVVFDSINRCSIYSNIAPVGHEITNWDNNIISVIVDTFSVMYPTDYYAEHSKNFEFDINHALISQVDHDLYISPDGDNSNSGLTQQDPLLNIQYALSILLVDSLQPHTLHLMEGTYSPSETGEYFPINIPDYCNLIGPDATQVILNAEETNSVISISSNTETTLSGMTITDGLRTYAGGGISCGSSNPVLSDLIITNNVAFDFTVSNGGGLYLSNSNPILMNVQITNNYALGGGGIYMDYSNPTITNVSFSGNSGGGIRINGNSNPIITNTIMWNDSIYEICFASSNSDPNSVNILHSNIQGGLAGILFQYEEDTVNWLEGNLNEDPQFDYNGDHPFSLSDGSPCIDAGTPDTTGLNLLPWDIIGNIRIWDGDNNGIAIIDMGAYEYGSLPVSINEPLMMSPSNSIDLNIFPNPFTQSTAIELELKEKGKIALSIYNQLGEKVETIYIGNKEKGTYQLIWNSENVSSGIYFIKLEANKGITTQKIIKK